MCAILYLTMIRPETVSVFPDHARIIRPQTEQTWQQFPCVLERAKVPWRLRQTEEIARQLEAAAPDLNVEIVRFETRGDTDQTGLLLPHGGKGGAFVAEIREAVLAGKLHAAMHSLKDMPGNEDTPGLVIGATLSRDPPTDALVLRAGVTFDDLKRTEGKGFKLGTNAVRRAAYARPAVSRDRSDSFSRARPIRGCASSTTARCSGSRRRRSRSCRCADHGAVGIGACRLAGRIAHEFTAHEMLPAAGQGIVAVECAASDWRTPQYLALIDDPAAHLCADAEREVLWVLNGHCNSPIAGFSTIDGREMSLTASVLDLEGDQLLEATRTGPATNRASLAARWRSICWRKAQRRSSSDRGQSNPSS